MPAQAQPDYHDRIIRDPAILVGKPIIRGTRIPVALILNLLAHGYDFGRIVEAYPQLTEDDIVAALAYAGERMEREGLRSLNPAP
ncbi:MAG TPA: DUF433 domain-containing protein [Thermomicrobiales bacterium]|nr:DUF433 domain-containing protein [Thermomicrobiales bacterium]